MSPICDYWREGGICGLGLGNCTAETCQVREIEGERQQ